MSEQRRLRLSPEVVALHERTTAAIAALEAAATPEEREAARATLLGLKDENIAQIKRGQARVRGMLEGQ